jgi:GAF domain-containing protein
VVIPIGVQLASESDFNHLLERMLVEAQTFCHADAGTLYLRTPDDRLEFVIARNNSLKIALGGTTGRPVTFPPLHLYDPTTGAPNEHHIVTRTVLQGHSINIPDINQAAGELDFSGVKAFDAQHNYHSASFLTIPLKNSRGEVIGAMQLINAHHPEREEVIPFDANLQRMMESFSSLAVAALEAYIREQNLRQEIHQLHIEINKAKQQQQVGEIVETDFFRDLRAKAENIRRRSDKKSGRERKQE